MFVCFQFTLNEGSIHDCLYYNDHIFEGLLGGLPYAVSVRAHNLEANVAQNMSGSFCSYAVCATEQNEMNLNG